VGSPALLLRLGLGAMVLLGFKGLAGLHFLSCGGTTRLGRGRAQPLFHCSFFPIPLSSQLIQPHLIVILLLFLVLLLLFRCRYFVHVVHFHSLSSPLFTRLLFVLLLGGFQQVLVFIEPVQELFDRTGTEEAIVQLLANFIRVRVFILLGLLGVFESFHETEDIIGRNDDIRH